jgi:hypothetical protein
MTMKKEAFREFSKIVLFCCNYSKRKVYIGHLKAMLGYYLTKSKKEGLIELIIKPEGVDIKFFDDYLKAMQEIGFIEFEKNCYGTVVVAKKRLEEKVYKEYQLQILREAIEKQFV